MTMAFADIDNDGDLDGYLATTAVPPPAGTKFEVMFVTENGKEKPVVLSNLKEYWDLIHIPGDPELGTEDRAQRVEAGQYDHLLRNDDGKFVDVSREAGIDGNYFTLSATWWDYDQDGYPDLYVSNDYTGPDQLYHNNGDGTFHNVIEKFTRHTPWFSMGSDVADLNNDGWLDFLAADL